jgi:hypothetical protein
MHKALEIGPMAIPIGIAFRQKQVGMNHFMLHTIFLSKINNFSKSDKQEAYR